jgi:molybdopterin-guanine dinucleotide biosynthesis protein A
VADDGQRASPPAAALLPGTRSGIVLVGGRSSRLGSPKALLKLGGAPLVRHVLHALAPLCDEMLLVAAPRDAQPDELRLGLADEIDRLIRSELLRSTATNRADAPNPAATTVPDATDVATRVRVVHDERPHLGPVSGLATGLAAARGETAFVTACDAPFLTPSLVAALLGRAEDEPALDVVLARWRGYLEPLVAVYRPRTMAAHFARQLTDDVLKPTARLDQRRVAILEEEEILRLDPGGRSFVNVNAPEDLVAARALAAREPTGITSRASRPARSRRGSSGDG